MAKCSLYTPWSVWDYGFGDSRVAHWNTGRHLCLSGISFRISLFEKSNNFFCEHLQSHPLWGPRHSMLLSPLSNSRSVSLKEWMTHIKSGFTLWQFYKIVFCIQNSLKHLNVFKILSQSSRFDSPETPGDAKDLRVGGTSRLSAIDDVECFIHALDLGSENVGFLCRFFWWFRMNVWAKRLILGMNIQKWYTRHFNCQYQLPVKILCVLLV